jgi:hypothetical protein
MIPPYFSLYDGGLHSPLKAVLLQRHVYGIEQSLAAYRLAEKIHCAPIQCPLARGFIIAGRNEDHRNSVIGNGGRQLTLEFDAAHARQKYVEDDTGCVLAMSA